MLNYLETRRPWLFPVLLAILTFGAHLTYGVWFWTKSPTNAAKTDLRTSGEEFFASYPTWNTDHEADAAFYNRGAAEVLRTGVPRTKSGLFLEHAPLYAYFLAACYKIGGPRLLALAVPQAALSALTCLLVGLTAMRLTRDHFGWAGFAASGLILINVRLAGYVGCPSPTSLLLFCFAAAIWALVRSLDFRPNRYLFFSALILAIYVQAAFFIVALAVVCWALIAWWRNRKTPLLLGAVILAAFALLKPAISMLIDRSQETHSHEAPTTILWEANNPYYESMTIFSLWERRPGNNWTKWKVTPAEEQRFNDYLQRGGGNGTKAALLWMRENPRDYLELCVVRFGAVFGPVTGQMSPLNKKISWATWLLLFPAGFWGLWKLRATPFAGLAVCVILFECGFEIMIMAGWQPRYRLPVDLMLCAAAGVVYAGWLGRFLTKSPPPA